MALTPAIIQDGILTYQQDGSPAQMRVGSAGWYAWLETASTFTFRSEQGHFTARKERAGNRRGEAYWRAYQKRGGKLHRAYLGKSEALTLERLRAIAAVLAGQAPQEDPSQVNAHEPGAAPLQILEEPQTRQHRSLPQLPALPAHPHEPEHQPSSPLETLAVPPNTLPVQPTPFIGRKPEVAAVAALLSRQQVRLLTLTGPGGTGKTRLGLQVAAELSDRFADGVFFVNLAPIRDPEFVLPAIALALDIKEASEQSPLDLLQASLREKHVLLLLDNFEQIVRAASHVAALLAACPKLKIMVTSRMVLHVRAEHEFAVPPLSLPDPTRLPDLVALSQSEAVTLFVERAQAVKADFALTEVNARAIAEICGRLDGLPLAIELAATRIKLLPAEALLAQLQHRLSVLTGGPRDLPARQQTLRNTLQWSYDLLTPDGQRLFRRFAVFAGGCQLAAAEAVCTVPGDVTMSVLDGLASLLDNSLLSQVEHAGEEPRFVMLETIREYGLACLGATGEAVSVKDAYADYYLALAEEAASKLASAEQGQWLARLEQEHEHLRASLGWLLECKDRLPALRLAGALWRFWFIRGQLGEGRKWLEQVLALGEESMEPATIRAARANVLGGAAILMSYQGEYRQARRFGEESLALFRDLGDQRGMAAALGSLGLLARFRSDYAEACALYEQSLAMLRELDDRWGIAQALSQLARALLFSAQPDYVAARSLSEESLAIFREFGDRQGTAEALFVQGFLAYRQGDYAVAQALMNEVLPISREFRDRRVTSRVLSILGESAQAQGHFAEARTFSQEALPLFQTLGDRWGIALQLLALAGVAAGLGQWVWAARFLGASAALNETLGISHPPAVQARYDFAVATARATLGEEPFAAEWREGRAMTLEQVLIALEQAVPMEHTASEPFQQPGTLIPRLPEPTTSDTLTPREVEVLRLLSQGLSNAQMAQQLIISPRTIHAHVRTIYSKLGVSSRAAATRCAIEHNLL